jgi:hypothetical protein
MQNFCSTCGTKLSDNQIYCSKCGSKIQPDIDSLKAEVKKEIVITERSLQTQSFDPKIKKISILIAGLFVALLISNAIFNLPFRFALNFHYYQNNYESTSREVDKFNTMHNKAWKIAEGEGKENVVVKMGYTTEQTFNELNNAVASAWPLLAFGSNLRPTLLILFMIIISFASKELIKDKTKFKWALILFNLLFGVVYALVVSYNTDRAFFGNQYFLEWRLVFYLLITGSVFFNLIAFYQSKKILNWIIIPTILGTLSFFFISFDSLLDYYSRAQLSSLFVYLLAFLSIIVSFILPSIAFYFFLKEFIYEPSPEKLRNTDEGLFSGRV